MVDNTQYGDVYTIRSDKNMDEILEHLSTGYVLDVMNTELERFLESPFDMNREPPNIVLSFENEFKKFYNDYPTDAENISASRLETYYYILDAFKSTFGLSFSVSDNPGENAVLAAWTYDLLVVHLNKYVYEFLGQYIVNNMEDIVAALDLVARGKGNIDTSMSKYYKNSKAVYCIYYTYAIIQYMASFDFSIHDIIDAAPMDSSIKEMLNTNIYDDGTFFRRFFGARFMNENYVAGLVSAIRTYITVNTRTSIPTLDDYIKK